MSRRRECRPTRTVVAVLCVLLLLWIDGQASGADAVSSASSDSASGCQVCAATRDCSRAYLNSPGQYCGPWLDQLNNKQSCCCPTAASCKLSNYSCRCSTIPSTTTKSSSTDSSGWIGVAIGIAVLLSCCIGGCWCFFNVTRRAARSSLPPQPIVIEQPAKYVMATPVPMQAAALPAYNVSPMYSHPTAPVYDYGYGYGYYGGADVHYHHHHSSGLSTGLGTVAGLAAGMIIVDAIADAGHHHHGYVGGYDGGGGFDGGGNFGGGGDFGGDF